MFATSTKFEETNEVTRMVVQRRICVVWCMAHEIPITVRIGHIAINCCMRKKITYLLTVSDADVCLSRSLFPSAYLPCGGKPIRTISGFLELIGRFEFDFRRCEHYIF